MNDELLIRGRLLWGWMAAGLLTWAGSAADTQGDRTALKTGASAFVTMVSEGEPGERLRLSGTLYEHNGRTPVAGAKLYVYHTDASGKYSAKGDGMDDERNPRLQCRLETNHQGRFEIRTILPGPYPGGKTPRHIHIMVTPPGGTEFNATFQFADDPNLTPEDYQRFGRDGTFSGIRPVERGPDGGLFCVRDIRLRGVEPKGSK